MSVTLRRKSSINDTRIAGLYDLAETIGKGHFAVVKAAKHVFTGERVAVKVIDKTKLDESCQQHLFQEVRCMKLVRHPNIVRLYEVIDTQSKLFLVLELGDFDMFDYIMKNGERGVAEPEAQRYFHQIVNAIAYCHTVHVVHRDLKPENVVFMEKLGMAKLTDFGFSNLFTPGQHLDTSCGSLAYSAPEILLGDSYDAPAVDVWSLGVILYMLVCGRLPFQEANDSETLTKILDCSYVLPNHLSEPCKQVIKRMLVRDPSARATLKEISSMLWVKVGDLGHAQILPVVSRELVSDDLHEQILEQMVTGKIASAEDICRAVETDDYSYITATYYLLLERYLRKERHEQAQKLSDAVQHANQLIQKQQHPTSLPLHHRTKAGRISPSPSTSMPAVDEEPQEDVSNVENNQPPPSDVCDVDGGAESTTNNKVQKPRPLWRQRTCSMVQEESEDDLSVHVIASRCASPVHGMSPQGSVYFVPTSNRKVSPAFLDLHELTGRLTSGSGTSGRTTPDRSGSRSPSPIEGRASPVVARYKSLPSLSRKLPTISSSPHLVGICEEGDDENAGATAGLTSDGQSQRTHFNSCDESSSSHQTTSALGHNRTFSGDSKRRMIPLANVGRSLTYSSIRSMRQRQTSLGAIQMSATAGTLTATTATATRLPHRRPSACRSASCSSSEASDDEERRRSLMRGERWRCSGGGTTAAAAADASRRRRDDDSDDAGGSNGGLSSTSCAGGQSLTTTAAQQAGGSASGSATQTRTPSSGGGGTKNTAASGDAFYNSQCMSPSASRNFAAALMDQLSPIKENFACNVLIGQLSPRPQRRSKNHGYAILDVKKLTSKLEKLVLAPIREIPPHFKALFWKTSSSSLDNSGEQSISAQKLQHRFHYRKQNGGKKLKQTDRHDQPPMEPHWLKLLFKAKSCESLEPTRPPTTAAAVYQCGGVKASKLNSLKNNDEKSSSLEMLFSKLDATGPDRQPEPAELDSGVGQHKSRSKHQHYRKKRKLVGTVAEKFRDKPVLQPVIYCDCHAKKWR